MQVWRRGVSQVFGVSHRFREGATWTYAAESLVRGVLSKPVAHRKPGSLRVPNLVVKMKSVNNQILSMKLFYRL